MAIDVVNDELLSLSKACRSLPQAPSPSTAWRWRTSGILVHGKRIKLDCVKVGGAWYTTQDAFAEFVRALTDAANIPNSGESSDRPARRSDAVEARLQKAGLLPTEQPP